MLNKTKIAFLIVVWILFTGILMLKDEKILKYHQLAIPINENKSKSQFREYCPQNILKQANMSLFLFTAYILNETPTEPRFDVTVFGAFADDNSNTSNFLFIHVQLIHDHVDDGSDHPNQSYTIYHDEISKIPIVESLDEIDTAKKNKKSYTFHINTDLYEQIGWNDTVLQLKIASNLPVNFPIDLAYDSSPIDKSLGIIYAAFILLGLYVSIIWEIIDRTFAAMIASTLAIAILAFMNDRPTMPEIISWIDVETLLLLFGMMNLVGILSETGLFDFLAVYAFKVKIFQKTF